MIHNISSSLFAFIICIICFSFYATSISLAYAQQEIQSNIPDDRYTMRNSTNGTSIDVKLETSPYPINVNQEPEFTVSFLKPSNDTLQDHVDFNLRIIKDSKQLFQATNQTGQPHIPLHAYDGYMTIPVLNYNFSKEGQYTIEVPVYGILFNPIIPEYAYFTVKVVPHQ